jgi:hypothetical protein
MLAGDEYFGDFFSRETVAEIVPRHACLSTREYTVMLAFAGGQADW